MNLETLQKKYESYAIDMRRHFHAHPEESEMERETARRIRQELSSMKIDWRICGMPSGTLAVIRGARPGRTFMLRADIDALSVTEETGCDFSSRNPGLMHACGHDCHTAMLLTAARMLKEIQDRLKGTVLLCFQPAEETGRGALSMVTDHVLEGVDAVFGMHVMSDVPSGMIALRTGPALAACSKFVIDIEGKSGHGARPEQCVDASILASSITMNLQTIVSRETSPVDTAVVTVGTIESGSRWNVVSGKARLTGTARCFSSEIQERLPGQIGRIAQSTARALGGTARVAFEKITPPTVNDAAMAELGRRAAQKILGEHCVFDCPPTMGGEDFAFYLEHVPGAMMFLGVRNEACGAVWPQHSSHYRVDEAMLIKGALIYTQTACDYLGLECGR